MLFASVKALLRMFPISNSGQVVLAEARLTRVAAGARPARLGVQRGLTLDAPADAVPLAPPGRARWGGNRPSDHARPARPAWVRAEVRPRDSPRHRANRRWLGGLRGRAESSAAPLSLCYAPSPSTTLHFLVHWRVKERSGRKEAQQTQVCRVSSPARGVVAPRSSSDGSLLLIVRVRRDRSGTGGASGTTRGGRLSKSVAKTSRAGIGGEKNRGTPTILFHRSGAIRAFATDLDNRPPGRDR